MGEGFPPPPVLHIGKTYALGGLQCTKTPQLQLPSLQNCFLSHKTQYSSTKQNIKSAWINPWLGQNFIQLKGNSDINHLRLTCKGKNMACIPE